MAAARPVRPPFSISRYTIHDPLHGDKPRSRRALNATIALGAVLDKPEWWVKWTQRPDVRAKWEREIAELLVKLNTEQVIEAWPVLGDVWRALEPILAIADAPAQEKEAAIDRVAADILYPSPHWPFDAFRLGVDYESDDEYRTEERRDEWHVDWNDSYEACAIDDDFPRVLAHHETQNSFCQISWYLVMEMARYDVRRFRPELPTLTREEIRGKMQLESMLLSGPDSAARLICDVVLSDTPITLELVQQNYPDETRENVLRLLLRHFEKISAFLEGTIQDIVNVLDLVIKYARLDDDAVADGARTRPGPVPQTWISDSAIPPELKDAFVAQVAALENVPTDQKDWHPKTNEQVLDLVHPSLFCGVIGETPVLPICERDALASTAAEQMRSIMFAPTSDRLEGPANPFRASRFQWLPSEFDVNQDGTKTMIRSYINSLHPEIHAELYDSIAAIFSRFVPLFDQVVSSLDDALIERGELSNYVLHAQKHSIPLRDPVGREQVVETLTRELGGGAPSSSLRRLVPPGLFDYANPQFSLKGSRCQVIVKIAEIVLTPEKPRYIGGSWHVEGTSNERIVATGLYYFASENITESRLAFRTFVGAPLADKDDFVGVALSYGLTESNTLNQELGSLSAIENRCVVFPNLYQHRVEPFQLADPTKTGVRKILAFFLVDPVNSPIPSTATVPPQQEDWIKQAAAVVEGGAGEYAGREGITLDAAKAIRQDLMQSRSFVSWETMTTLSYSLCEH